MTSMASVDPPSPLPLPSPTHPHLQSQSFDRQPSIWSAFLSLGTQLHYRHELSYCKDPTAPFFYRRGWGLAGHRGIMQWPGFRGQFTHCLKSISRNASLNDCPLFSVEGPLTATQSISALNIFTVLNKCIFLDTKYIKSWLLIQKWPNSLS